MKTIRSETAAGLMKLPLPGHAFHHKSDDELSGIIKEASQAATAMRCVDRGSQREYLKQVDDACIILNYRASGPLALSANVGPPQQRKVRTYAAKPTTPKNGPTAMIAPNQTQALPECPVCKAKAMALAQRQQRKLEMINRIEALTTDLEQRERTLEAIKAAVMPALSL